MLRFPGSNGGGPSGLAPASGESAQDASSTTGDKRGEDFCVSVGCPGCCDTGAEARRRPHANEFAAAGLDIVVTHTLNHRIARESIECPLRDPEETEEGPVRRGVGLGCSDCAIPAAQSHTQRAAATGQSAAPLEEPHRRQHLVAHVPRNSSRHARFAKPIPIERHDRIEPTTTRARAIPH